MIGQISARTSFEPASNQHRTSSEPASVLEFGFYTLFTNRLYSRLDNRLYRVNKHPTGCQIFVKPIVKPVWQPVWQRCWTNSCSFNRLSNRVVQPVWQSAVYTIQPVVKRLSIGFDNRLNVCIHNTTGCQPGLTSGLTTNRFDNRLYRVNGALRL